MNAILKREFLSYFSSPIGYIVMAAFFAFGGFYFYMTCLVANSANISYTFSNLFIITIFLIPILTMRLFSEEKKQQTEAIKKQEEAPPATAQLTNKYHYHYKKRHPK